VLELPWESRTISTPGMSFTVNNHPIQPSGCVIEDHVTVDVPRTGMLNQELLDDPGFGASTSPTIQCLNFYWLSPRRTFDPAGFSAVSGEADALPLAHGCQRVFRSLTGPELLDAQVNTLHVPLKALAERLDRRDLVLGAARELRV
ncbi:MAG: hypothetical protein AB7G09_02680, partial [Pseudonocardia sp.]